MSKWASKDFSYSTILTSFLVIQFDFLENRIMTHAKAFAASGNYEEPNDPTVASQAIYPCIWHFYFNHCQYIRNLKFMLWVILLQMMHFLCIWEFFYQILMCASLFILYIHFSLLVALQLKLYLRAFLCILSFQWRLSVVGMACCDEEGSLKELGTKQVQILRAKIIDFNHLRCIIHLSNYPCPFLPCWEWVRDGRNSLYVETTGSTVLAIETQEYIRHVTLVIWAATLPEALDLFLK